MRPGTAPRAIGGTSEQSLVNLAGGINAFDPGKQSPQSAFGLSLSRRNAKPLAGIRKHATAEAVVVGPVLPPDRQGSRRY